MRYGLTMNVLLLCVSCLSNAYAAVPPPYISYANEEDLQFEARHCLTAVKTALNKDGFQRITVRRQHIFGAYRRTADYRYKTIISCFASQGLIQVVVVTDIPNSALKKAKTLLTAILQHPRINAVQTTVTPTNPANKPPSRSTAPTPVTPSKEMIAPQLDSVGKTAVHHYLIGNAHFNAKDYKQALASYSIAAAHGEQHAQYQLGRLYYEGLGVKQDFIQAYTWWLLAEARGYANAKRARDTVIRYLNATQIAQGQENARVMLEQLPMR